MVYYIVTFLIFFLLVDSVAHPNVSKYFDSIGASAGYYLFIHESSNVAKYVKYYVTGIVISRITTNVADKTYTCDNIKISLRKSDLVNSSFAIVNNLEVLVAVMPDATAIDTRLTNSETRLTTLESDSGLSPTSTTIFDGVVYIDHQLSFDILSTGKTYIDMRKIFVSADAISGYNTTTTPVVNYETGSIRTMGCSFTVTTAKKPVLATSYASLPNTITVKNGSNNITMVKSSAETGWSPVPSMLKSVYPKTKIVYGYINHTIDRNSGPDWYAVNRSSVFQWLVYFPNILTGQPWALTDIHVQITSIDLGVTICFNSPAGLGPAGAGLNAYVGKTTTDKYISMNYSAFTGGSFYFTFMKFT